MQTDTLQNNGATPQMTAQPLLYRYTPINEMDDKGYCQESIDKEVLGMVLDSWREWVQSGRPDAQRNILYRDTFRLRPLLPPRRIRRRRCTLRPAPLVQSEDVRLLLVRLSGAAASSAPGHVLVSPHSRSRKQRGPTHA